MGRTPGPAIRGSPTEDEPPPPGRVTSRGAEAGGVAAVFVPRTFVLTIPESRFRTKASQHGI